MRVLEREHQLLPSRLFPPLPGRTRASQAAASELGVVLDANPSLVETPDEVKKISLAAAVAAPLLLLL